MYTVYIIFIYICDILYICDDLGFLAMGSQRRPSPMNRGLCQHGERGDCSCVHDKLGTMADQGDLVGT